MEDGVNCYDLQEGRWNSENKRGVSVLNSVYKAYMRQVNNTNSKQCV